MQGSVVRVNEQRDERTGLGSPVPAIGAVHQHAHSLQTQRLEKDGRNGIIQMQTKVIILTLSLSNLCCKYGAL
jgi:hypothetical protein